MESVRTLLIGIDAATWTVMLPLLREGKLPNIGALADTGAWGPLRSTIPPMTPPAWASMATGVNPGKHGIYDFLAQNPQTYRVSSVNYSKVRRPFVWDLFNAHDKRVGVVNFPLAFPPPEVKSFFVSGLGAPHEGGIAHPPELNHLLASRDYRIYPRFGPSKGAARYVQEVKHLTEIQCEMCIELMLQHDWDLFWVVLQGLDWIQHYFWNTSLDGESVVAEFYCFLDRMVGRLLDQMDSQWNLIILSDHGFREIQGEVHTNNILEEWGYVRRKQEPPKRTSQHTRSLVLNAGRWLGTRLPYRVKQGVKGRIPQNVKSELRMLASQQFRLHEIIDWGETTAFSYGYMGRIWIHEQGKYPLGRVAPGGDVASLREEIAERLKALRDPNTGNSVVGEVFFKEDIYAGDHLDAAPDILIQPRDSAYMFYGDFGHTWLHRPKARVADHEPDGILIVNGKHIRRGALVGAELIDIVPTLLHLHGLPLPGDIDGSVLRQALSDEFLASRDVQVTDALEAKGGPEYVYDEAEEREIEQRLAALGYL